MLVIGTWPSKSLKVIRNGATQHAMYHILWVVCSNNVPFSCTIFEILPFLQCTWLPVTLRCPKVLTKQLKLHTKYIIWLECKYIIVNMCYTSRDMGVRKDQKELGRIKTAKWPPNLQGHPRSLAGQMTQPTVSKQCTEGSSSPKDRLQSHQIHLTMLQTYACMQYTVINVMHRQKWI